MSDETALRHATHKIVSEPVEKSESTSSSQKNKTTK
jgi:hypothetical protein